MAKLSVDLIKYREDHPKHRQILNELADQYQTCKSIIDLANDGIHKTYLFKYSDVNNIENLLVNEGYIESPKKPVSR